MISPACDMESHLEGGKNRAAVCSMPPSDVGVGISASDWTGKGPAADEDSFFATGRKYIYI